MCTSFRLNNADSSVVVGRTMEFGYPVNWDLHVVPRGTQQHGTAPDGMGAQWTAKYGYVGIAPGHTVLGPMEVAAQDGVADGVNEAGLWVGLLYLPTFAKYQDPTGVPSDQLMGSLETANYLLATCASVAEAIAVMEKVTVWPAEVAPLGVIPLHIVLHDKSGACGLVEYTEGERQTYEPELGVVTNSPPFPWHQINLRNYVNLTADDVPDVVIGGDRIIALGEGTGLLGLPGDYTPPSRFVRAVALSGAAWAPKDLADGVNTAFHILGSFDIPKGTVRNVPPPGMTAEQAKSLGLGGFTNFSAVAELTDAPAYVVSTYDDVTPKRLGLTEELVGDKASPVVRSIMGTGEIGEWVV